MKPLKLTMSAFGSYAQETVIDFTDVQQGIFLVTGDTGAGKTTVFDAIVYALYDKTSGQKREGGMMRSQYASPDVQTFVELTFVCRGEIYTVRRNPEYQRPKKRKNADGSESLTTEKANVSLQMPDGSDYAGNKSAVNKKIIEIIGLDVQQFTQIVMIAQGDFLRLLHASSQDRKQIFSRIFDTSMYRKIQESLKEQVKEGKVRLEDYRKAVIREMEHAVLPEGYEQKEGWKELLRTTVMPDVDTILEHLESMCILGKSQKRELEQLLKEKQQKTEQLQVALEAGKAINELFVRLSKVEAQKKMLDEQKEKSLLFQKKKEEAEKAIIVRQVQLQLEEKEKARKQLERQQIQLSEEVQKEKTQLHKKLEMLDQNCIKLQKDCEAAMASVEKEKTQYEMMYRMFLRAQAGFMAEQLQEGEMCPVCGSVHHPDKAKLPEGAPKEQMVEEQKQRWEFGVTELQKRQEQLQKERNAKEEKHRSLLLEISKKEGRLESVKTQIEETLKQQETAQKEYIKAIETAGFQDETAYLSARMEEKEFSVLTEQLERFKEAQIRVDENYRICKEQTQGKQSVDLSNMEAEILELKKEKQLLEKQHQNLMLVYTKNREARDNIKTLQITGEALRKEYEIILTLAKTANGNLSQSIKLDFETYIQRQFFMQVIHSANQRFIRMTSGQLMLRCRDLQNLSTQGQAGLDIDVYSPVTNSVRDVKTLSGGESFMAALSMALGMAEVISSSAGSIRMETMFIDEGFGSLDDDSRAQAITVLNELVGSKRLIGIISHVAELKEQIDRKLVVERTDKGSKVHWEL